MSRALAVFDLLEACGCESRRRTGFALSSVIVPSWSISTLPDTMKKIARGTRPRGTMIPPASTDLALSFGDDLGQRGALQVENIGRRATISLDDEVRRHHLDEGSPHSARQRQHEDAPRSSEPADDLADRGDRQTSPYPTVATVAPPHIASGIEPNFSGWAAPRRRTAEAAMTMPPHSTMKQATRPCRSVLPRLDQRRQAGRQRASFRPATAAAWPGCACRRRRYGRTKKGTSAIQARSVPPAPPT